MVSATFVFSIFKAIDRHYCLKFCVSAALKVAVTQLFEIVKQKIENETGCTDNKIFLSQTCLLTVSPILRNGGAWHAFYSVTISITPLLKKKKLFRNIASSF